MVRLSNKNFEAKIIIDKNLLKKCLIWTFVLGLAAHAFQFLNFQYTHDSLDGLYFLGRENVHKIGLGRMFSPLYRYAFLGTFSIPWLSGVLGLLWIAVASYFVILCLDIESEYIVPLVCGVMAVNQTVTALAATYIHDFDANMFAMMLCCFAVFAWKTKRKALMVLGAIAIAFSLGLYQSYISVSIVLIMMVLLLQLIEKAALKELMLQAMRALLMGISGGLFMHCHLKQQA